MKIAQIVCTFPPYKGGIGNSAHQFYKILEKQHKVTNFSPNIQKVLFKYGNGAFMPGIFFKLRKFDTIYLHYPFFGTAEVIWLFKIFFKKPKLIIHYHMDVQGLSWIAKILSIPSKIIRKSLLKKAETITCASLDYISQSNIKNIYKKYPEKFVEISFSVNENKFKRIMKEENRITNILFVGGLDSAHYFKGLNILLKSCSKLKDDYTLNIVGDGNLKKEYIQESKKLNISTKTNFLGKCTDDELIKQYQNADIFVLPSINSNEAFGIVILEAMACGTPVIASDLPGVRKVFNNNQEGILIKPNDVNDLTDKLTRLIVNDREREIMGGKARKLIEKKYTEKIFSNKLYRVFYENLSN